MHAILIFFPVMCTWFDPLTLLYQYFELLRMCAGVALAG